MNFLAKPSASLRGSATLTQTTCPYCGVGCGVLASAGSDADISVTGDPSHPANKGRLCSKGTALAETLCLEQRLLHPQIDQRRVNWPDALQRVADEFTSVIEQHGPDAVAFYVSGQLLTEDYYVANKLMKGYIASANIDTNSRLCMASSVAGHKRAFGADTVPGNYADLELADLVVLVGSNLAWCHPVLYQRLLAAKQQRPGMQLVVIDPRRTITAETADLHLAIKPDSDAALFNGLLSSLVHGNHLDDSYIRHHTVGFRQAVSKALEHGINQISTETGIAEQQLLAFYALFCNTEKTVTVYSQGVNQSSCGSDKVNAILNCHLASGRVGKPGAGPFSVTGQPNAMGGREVGGLANMLASHMEIDCQKHRDLVQHFWQSPTLAAQPGLKAIDLFHGVEDGRVKALWIMATNPADSMPDADRVSAAIAACPFVVVSDVVQHTDTTKYADVLLPAQAWGEKDGTVTNSERLISRQRRFRRAPGQAMPDWWAVTEVAKRMGFGTAFDYPDAASIFREHAALSAFGNNGSRDFDIGAWKDCSATEYDGMSPFYWPCIAGAKNGPTRFFADGQFYHADKRARFIPITVRRDNRLTVNRPFSLNTGRIRDQWHTMTRTGYSQRLSAHRTEPYIELHPQDADGLGIQQADVVKVHNDYGAVVVRAQLSNAQQVGSVFIPIHWTNQFASSARVDTLVPALTDPVSGQPASKHVAVAIDRMPMACFGFAVCREQPALIQADYWSISRCKSGWRIEFALKSWPHNNAEFVSALFSMPYGADLLTYSDKARDDYRMVAFNDQSVSAAVYLSTSSQRLSRSWVTSQLQAVFASPPQRHHVAAGCGRNNQPDIGEIVCSCHCVGLNQLTDVISAGCTTVDAIGEKTSAGTNCGSCRTEISRLLLSELA